MKAIRINKGLILLLASVFIITACNKEEEPVPGDLAELSFDAEEILDRIPVGLKNATDEYAQSCYSYIEDAVDMSGFISNMEVPEEAQRSSSKGTSESWQWTWSYGGESFTFYWDYEESGGKRYWNMDISFNNGPRLGYIDAWETLDGTEGELVYNWEWAIVQYGEQVEETDLVHWRYHWKLDQSGTYTLNFVWDADGTDVDNYLEHQVVIYADGSGYLDYYLNDALFYHMQWDYVGNGSWSWYSEGVVFMDGTWTV